MTLEIAGKGQFRQLLPSVCDAVCHPVHLLVCGRHFEGAALKQISSISYGMGSAGRM